VLRNVDTVSPKQHRIAELAKRSPEMAFTSLAHLMDLAWLREAYRRTRKDGAVGIDGVRRQKRTRQTWRAISSLSSTA
jgi:RNA-directed DNA polymerase